MVRFDIISNATTTTSSSTYFDQDDLASLEYYDDDILNNGSSSIFPTETEEDTITTTPLSDTQEIVLSSISLVTGLLSVVGSSLIIWMVLSSPRKSSYKRIMLGLSATDSIASVAFALTPFLLPAETSHRVWASGTDNTCSFLGFVYQFSWSTIWYNGFLSYYYLFTIRYAVPQKSFAQKYEPWVHVLALGFPVATASLGWALDWYSEFAVGQGCWISGVPKGCYETDGVECYGALIAWVFGGIPNIFMFFSIIVNNVVILRFVRNTTRRLNKFGHNANTRNRQQEKKVTAVARQCFFYVFSFILSYCWMLALRICSSLNIVDESRLYPLLVLQATFHPLQGLTNCFVYSRPNYLRNRQQYPNNSRWWALKRVWFEKRRPNDAAMAPTGFSGVFPNSSRLSATSEWFSNRTDWFLRKSSHMVASSSPRISGKKRKSRRMATSSTRHSGSFGGREGNHKTTTSRIMEDSSMAVHANHNDVYEEDLDEIDYDYASSLRFSNHDPNSSGGDLALSSNDSFSRGLLSSLGDISEGDEEFDSDEEEQEDKSSTDGRDWARRRRSSNTSLLEEAQNKLETMLESSKTDQCTKEKRVEESLDSSGVNNSSARNDPMSASSGGQEVSGSSLNSTEQAVGAAPTPSFGGLVFKSLPKPSTGLGGRSKSVEASGRAKPALTKMMSIPSGLAAKPHEATQMAGPLSVEFLEGLTAPQAVHSKDTRRDSLKAIKEGSRTTENDPKSFGGMLFKGLSKPIQGLGGRSKSTEATPSGLDGVKPHIEQKDSTERADKKPGPAFARSGTTESGGKARPSLGRTLSSIFKQNKPAKESAGGEMMITRPPPINQDELGVSDSDRSSLGASMQSLEFHEAASTLKAKKQETLAEKLHRSFGGMLGVEEYKVSLKKGELSDVMDLVKELNHNDDQRQHEENSESGSEY